MHFVLASSWLDPIVNAISWLVLDVINKPINNLGWSLIVLAAIIRLVFWPLNVAQFRSMLKMQQIAPKIKALQAKFKDDSQRLQQETMALYKANKVNPFAGCWPMLVQYPFIISVYYVVLNHRSLFENQTFAWVGSGLSATWPQIFASSLAHPDVPLIILYAASMYLSVRFGSMPATDPQQAQTQKIMSIMSPLMLGFFGWKYQWPSAMVLYWFAYNLFTMAQTFYMLRRYHEPLSFADSGHVITDDVPPAIAAASSNTSSNGSGKKKQAKQQNGGSQQPQQQRSKKKK